MHRPNHMTYRSVSAPGALALSLILGCVRICAAEPALPAGDEYQFTACYVEADDKVFADPDVAVGPWNELIPKQVPLLPQNVTTPSKFQTSVAAIDVRVVHNGTWIGVAVSWLDDAPDQITATGVFSDAVAVGFPKGDPFTTSSFMGHPGLVEINYWKALWQHDIDHGYQEVTDLHPYTVADEYVGYRSEHLPDSNPASSVPIAEVMASPEGLQALPAIAIGNPVSQLHRETPVEQLVAEGYGTLTTQKQQDSRADGVYADGRWTVVITRPLNTGDSADSPLMVDSLTTINFAVWQGGAGDVSGRKNYAMFTPMLIAAQEE